MPDVLLAIGAQDSAIVGDEVCRVVEKGFPVGTRVFLDDCSWYYADLQLFRERLVVGEVLGGIAGLDSPAGVIGDPAA